MFSGRYKHILVRDPEGARELVEAGDGLGVQLGLTTVGQYATDSLTDREGLVTFTYDFAGGWRLIGEPGADKTEGILSWWVRGGRPVGAPSDSDLGADVGSVWSLNANLVPDAVLVQELF